MWMPHPHGRWFPTNLSSKKLRNYLEVWRKGCNFAIENKLECQYYVHSNVRIQSEQRVGTAQTCRAVGDGAVLSGQVSGTYTRGAGGTSRVEGCRSWAFPQNHVPRHSPLPMKYHQRDIVEVSFLFPDGSIKQKYFDHQLKYKCCRQTAALVLLMT